MDEIEHPGRDDVVREIMTKLTVSVWPTAGQALGLSKNAAYEAARRGDIPIVRIGGSIRVLTAPLRRMLGLEMEAA